MRYNLNRMYKDDYDKEIDRTPMSSSAHSS